MDLSGFENGNWVVNRISHEPFRANGAVHAPEHVDRVMKGAGGLVGITQCSNKILYHRFRTRVIRCWSLRSGWSGLRPNDNVHHHAVSYAVMSRHEKCIGSPMRTIQTFTNSFEGLNTDLANLVTREIVPETVKNDLIAQPKVGQDLFEAFVSNCIKRQTKAWNTTEQQLSVTLEEEIVELQEDQGTFACMQVLKSKPDSNIEQNMA